MQTDASKLVRVYTHTHPHIQTQRYTDTNTNAKREKLAHRFSKTMKKARNEGINDMIIINIYTYSDNF